MLILRVILKEIAALWFLCFHVTIEIWLKRHTRASKAWKTSFNYCFMKLFGAITLQLFHNLFLSFQISDICICLLSMTIASYQWWYFAINIIAATKKIISIRLLNLWLNNLTTYYRGHSTQFAWMAIDLLLLMLKWKWWKDWEIIENNEIIRNLERINVLGTFYTLNMIINF